MKIFYLHQHFVAPSGTSGGRSYEFGRRLVARGHRVTLITGAFEHSGLSTSGRRSIMNVDGIEVRVLGVPYRQRMSPLRRLQAFAGFMLAACRESLRIERPDVVFATSTPLTIAIPGMWAARWHRCPFVFEVRDLWPAAPIELGVLRNPLLIGLARWLERAAYRRATAVVALSPGMKEGIEATGVPATKVTVIPNASDVELFRVDPEVGRAFRAHHSELGQRPWVVYAGAFGRVNGVEWGVRLAARVAELDPAVAFIFCGAGSERAFTEALACELGLLGRTVFFHEPIPRVELPRLLSAATILCSFAQNLPVMRTNSANKFFDAFAAGKPVVINYRGWQAELLERTGAGLVLDQDDVPGSAMRLVAALHDPAWLERAAEASAQLGDTEFNRDRLADQLEEVLRRAVEGHLPSARVPAAIGPPWQAP